MKTEESPTEDLTPPSVKTDQRPDKIHGKYYINNKLVRNVVSNYVFVFWMAGLNLVLIPVYLKILGSDQWGAVVVCLTFQGMLSVLDAGIGQVMPKDVAAARGCADLEFEIYKIYQYLYLLIGVFGFIAGQFFVDYICDFWIIVGDDQKSQIIIMMRVVLFQFLFQFVNNSNIGYMNGKQEQVLVNIVQFVVCNIKHLANISCLIFISSSAITYVSICVVFAGLELIVFSFINNKSQIKLAKIQISKFKIIIKNASVVSIGVIVGMLGSQVDRVLLLKYLDLSNYGKYVVISSFGLAFAHLQYPLIRAFLPKIASSTYCPVCIARVLVAIFALCIAPCVFVIIFASYVLDFWLGSQNNLIGGAMILRFILVGVVSNALYNVIYQFMLVSNSGRTIFVINLLAIIGQFCTILFLVGKIGALAGGAAWMFSGILQLLLGLVWFSFVRDEFCEIK